MLLALLSATLVSAQTPTDYTCKVIAESISTPKDSVFTTDAHFFVPDGPYAHNSMFYFLKRREYLKLNIRAVSDKQDTYKGKTEFLFTLDDGSTFFVATGPEDVVGKFNTKNNEYNLDFELILDDATISKILTVGLKDIRMGNSYAGGFRLLPLAKKKFMADLACISAKVIK